ncbi:MAG: hypothetical protein IE927_12535 [Rhodobacterales bacterium]|nr:hypothetical protein [Rhodobacterales bacterium]
MTQTSPSEAPVVARLSPSPLRRALAAVLLIGVGGLLLGAGVEEAPTPLAVRVLLVGAGAVLVGLAVAMWRATARGLELTKEVLRDTSGQVLVRVDQIRGIERGAFALKPAAGFVLRLDHAAPAVWVPGLWWRVGRRLGVGGVAGRIEARVMAETIETMVLLRSRPDLQG